MKKLFIGTTVVIISLTMTACVGSEDEFYDDGEDEYCTDGEYEFYDENEDAFYITWPPLSDELTAHIKNVMSENNARGLSVAVFEKNGNIIYQECFGYRDEENKLPVTPDTVFGLASVTKSFTALAVMQLAEKGIIDINKPVSFYIPEFILNDEITVLHLMNNTSGIPTQIQYGRNKILVNNIARELGYEREDGDFAFNERIAEQGAKALTDYLNNIELVGSAGEIYEYTNYGWSLLSEIVRRNSNEPTFPSYVKKHILEPLDMSRSGGNYIWDDDNVSVLYDEDGNTYDFYHNNVFDMGGGGMKSTTSDMIKYICMYMNKGTGLNENVIIGSEYIDMMTDVSVKIKDNRYYGLGLVTAPSGAIPRIWHTGGQTGVSSYMVWTLDGELGLIVLCNTRGVDVGGEIGYSVLKYFYDYLKELS